MISIRNLCISIIFAFSNQVLAGEGVDVSQCLGALVMNSTTYKNNISISVAYLDSINEQSYSDSRIRENASAIMGDIPLTGSFEDFQTKRNEYERNIKYNFDSHQNTELIQYELSDASERAYKDCVEQVAYVASRGFQMKVLNLSPDVAAIELNWSPFPGDDGSKKLVHADILNGSIASGKAPPVRKKDYPINGAARFTIIINREPHKDLSLSFNVLKKTPEHDFVDGYATIIPRYVDVEKRITNLPEVDELTACRGGGDGDPAHASGWSQEVTLKANSAIDGAELIPDSAKFVLVSVSEYGTTDLQHDWPMDAPRLAWHGDSVTGQFECSTTDKWKPIVARANFVVQQRAVTYVDLANQFEAAVLADADRRAGTSPHKH